MAVNTSESQTLVLQYLPLVRILARQIYGGLPPHAAVELGDVVQAGHIGLVNASRSYHPDISVPFASFARYRIRGEILDSLRKLDTAPRGLRRWQRHVDRESRALTAVLCREPSEEEVSHRMGMDLGSLRTRRLSLWYSSSCGAGHGGTAADSDSTLPAASPQWGPDFPHQHRQMRQFLVRAGAVLPPKSRKVVALYYLRSLTMKQIGVMLRINESRVSQIHKHALETMARGLRAAGVRSSQDL